MPMRASAMPMHLDTMLMRASAMPLHLDTMSMRAETMLMHHPAMPMHHYALKTLCFYAKLYLVNQGDYLL